MIGCKFLLDGKVRNITNIKQYRGFWSNVFIDNDQGVANASCHTLNNEDLNRLINCNVKFSTNGHTYQSLKGEY